MSNARLANAAIFDDEMIDYVLSVYWDADLDDGIV